MPAYTSTTSGNFNAAATWGGSGFPSLDGDTFTIVSGHTVTYNVTTALTTGLGTSTVNAGGKISFSSGTRMRINGDFNVSGELEMFSNTQLNFRGTNRQLYFPGSSCRVNLVGSNSTPTTTLTSSVAVDRPILPVASAASFAAGEWISVYISHETKLASYDTARSYANNTTDEGFIINAISGANVFIREFVGPNTTVSAISSNTITVANAQIFREYQQIIVANNTTFANIVSIDYDNNQMVLDTSWSAGIVGNTIYTTGTLKNHINGETVRKNAWWIPGAYATGCTAITVSTSSGLAVNDIVHLTGMANTSITGGATRSDTCEHTITAINGNILTISPGAVNGSAGGEFLFKTNRDIVIAADTGNTSSYRVWSDYTYDNSKRLRIKDVRFQNIGNFYGQGGFNINGQWNRYGSAISNDIVGSEIENNIIQMQAVSGYIDPWNYDLNGIFSDEFFGNTMRNNIMLNCHSVAMVWYDWDRFVYNNYSYNGAYGFRCEGIHGYDYGGSEMAYNLTYRGNEGNRISFYNACRGYHHNKTYNSNRAMHVAFSLGIYAFQNEFVNCYNWTSFAATDSGSRNLWRFYYNNFVNVSVGTDNWRIGNDTYVQSPQFESVKPFTFHEHNYDVNAIMQSFPYGHRIWNNAENAWRTYRTNNTNIWAGCATTFYVPPKSTITVTATIKRPNNYAGTLPYFKLQNMTTNVQYAGTQSIYASGFPVFGESNAAQFSAASLNNYESLTLTLPARNFGRHISATVFSDSAASFMGWWEREMEIQVSNTTPVGAKSNDFALGGVKSSTNKIVIGG